LLLASVLAASVLARPQAEPGRAEPGRAEPGRAEPGQGAAADEIPLSLRVNRAIACGVDFLRRLQLPGGGFTAHEAQHPGGMTALVAFTWLRSGVRRKDPDLLAALASLSGRRFESTYSAAVHLLLCEALGDPAWRESAEASTRFLIETRDRGAWAYPWKNPDNSNTQFALLGLRAARRMGLEVSEGVLIDALDGLGRFDARDGGFTYHPDSENAYAGMTAATLASYAVLREAASDGYSRLGNALGRESRRIEAAERWMERNFDPARNRFGDGAWRSAAHYAYLWAVERWCGLTAREEIAGRDWYAEGARWLVDDQNRDGSWGVERHEENTCFALLFLRRATMSPRDELEEIYSEIDRQRDDRPWGGAPPGREAHRLTDWWLAGPWPEKGKTPILEDPPFDPARLEPHEKGRVARQEWRRVTLDEGDWTDLGALVGNTGKRQLWLLSTWLEVTAPEGSVSEEPGEPASDRPPTVREAQLWLELDEGWDVWLDGRRVSLERRRNPRVLGDVRFQLRLEPGLHALTVLLDDRDGRAAFGATLTRVDSPRAPPGITGTAAPGLERAR